MVVVQVCSVTCFSLPFFGCVGCKNVIGVWVKDNSLQFTFGKGLGCNVLNFKYRKEEKISG